MSADGSMLKRRRHWLLAGLCIGIGAWAAVLWGAALDRSDARQLLADANRGNVAALERAFDEFQQLIEDMHARQALTCTPDSLEFFRRHLFTLKHLRDVGLVRDRHLLCSTALGAIEQPVRSSDPDFMLVGGVEVYAYRPVRVSARQPTMVLQTAELNALVDPGLIGSLSGRYPVERTWIHAEGDAIEFELFDRSRPAVPGLEDRQCSQRHGFCLRAAAGPTMPSKPLRRAGLAVLGGGSGLAVFLFGQMLVWRRQSPIAHMRRAIRNGDLQAYYQPIVRLPDQRLAGFELLARWPLAPEGLQGPERFVPEAETLGLIHDLTAAMIETAARQLTPLLRARPDLHLAINISAKELDDERLERVLRERFVDRGVPASQIVLELTERSVASPQRDCINRLAGQGYRIYIDDLGEGYSSLSYLHDLDLSGVKISRSFTSGLGTDSPKVELVRAMVELARRLDLDVVLEGIETDAGHVAVQALGPVCCQGYFYGRPMALADLLSWVERHSRDQDG